MKKIIILLLSVCFVFMTASGVEAKSRGGYYYKSAKTGRFTSRSYYNSHPATTYRSKR